MNKVVRPSKGLQGQINIPPDKSISHRKALFSAINNHTNIIQNYSEAADPQSTLECLRALGVEIRKQDDNLIIVGCNREFPNKKNVTLDCGNSGTTMRLLLGIVAGAGVEATFIGDESLSSRPMKRVMDPLGEMGAIIKSNSGNAPLFNSPASLHAINYRLPVASAQVKSCVLLAGLFSKEKTTVIESEISRDHTERMLGLSTEKVGEETRIYSSASDNLPSQSGIVPGDISAAAFWMVAASIVEESDLTLINVGLNPSRTAVIDVLLRMGADIEVELIQKENEPYGNIRVRSANLKATSLLSNEIANAIDEIPIISVAMAFAEGISEVKGASELRVKETDRIHAVSFMLSQAEITHKTFYDGFSVQGNPNHEFPSAKFKSFHDHRLAMSSAILSLKGSEESEIEGAEASSISYPNFWSDLKKVSSC